MPKFFLKFHEAVIKEIPIEKTPITIGRKPDNDIIIDNMSVSGHHARVIMQGTSYILEDLQSTNGTFLNDKKIITSALKHKDKILLGQHTLEFQSPETQTQAAPADSEATVVMTPQKQKEILSQEAKPQAAQPQQEQAAPKAAPKGTEQNAVLKVIEGKSDQMEYQLTALLTYIGKSDTAIVKIKGIFAPDIAALISKRPTGYLFTAVKDGYPKLNGKAHTGQVDLKDGDLIEAGGIKFLFQLK